MALKFTNGYQAGPGDGDLTSGLGGFTTIAKQHDKNDWLFGIGMDDVGNLVTQGGDGLSDSPDKGFGSDAWLEQQFINSGLPERYRDAFFNNPGVKAYLSIAKNKGVGKLLHNLGFNTGRDKARLDAKAQAFNYIQQLVDKYQDEQFNSPLSKAAQERAAGLNPNLAGLDAAESSPGLSNPTVDPAISDNLSPAGSDLSSIASVASSIMNFRQMAINMKLLDKQARSVGLSNTQDIIQVAQDAAEDSITPAMFQDYAKDSQAFLDSALITGDALARSYGFESPLEIRAFNTAFNSHFNSVFTKNASYDAFVNGLSNRYKHRSFAYRLEHNAPDIEAELAVKHLEIEKKYADLEKELLDSKDFTKLFKSDKYASLRADVAESLLSAIEDEQEKIAFEQFISSGGVSEMSQEMLQSYKTAISEELSRQKEADLAAADADSMLAFLAGERVDGVSRRESRRRYRFARRQSKQRYGDSSYYRHWHSGAYNTALSWGNASNYLDK